MFVPDVCFEYKIELLYESHEDQEFQVSKSIIARLTFCWRKASDPNHPSTYALNKNTMN
jgi:hypothetical protein